MAKCYNCGKNFDYEKYYGICPKCGSYNRENLSEESHAELHEAYDTAEDCGQVQFETDHYGRNLNEDASQSYDQSQGYAQMEYEQSRSDAGDPFIQAPTGNGSSYDQTQWGTGNTYGQTSQAKASSAGTIVFILLIIGIIATIAVPIIYLITGSVRMTMGAADTVFSAWEEYDTYEEFSEEDQEAVQEYLDSLVDQNPSIVEASVGTACQLGPEMELEVTVLDQARVIVPAGTVDDFPAHQNLVAIPVNSQVNDDFYYTYDVMEILYVGYGQGFYKEVVSSYSLEGYEQYLGDISVMDYYSVCEGQNQGDLLVFVPEDVTSITLYLESRDIDSGNIQAIYGVTVDIQSGEVQ